MLKVDGIPRCVSAADTVANLRTVAESLGVTRLADITGLDRIGIPVYSAIVPDSRDLLSVYNGKGLRPVDAKAGALMEAIERQTALKVRLPFIEGAFAELRESKCVLDPKHMNLQLSPDYSDDRTYSWCEGLDIVSGQPCYVPSKLAGFMWHDVPHPSPFVLTDTNGLASGNCREEAICHALCELAERDAWTEAELGAHHLPRQRRLFALGPAGEVKVLMTWRCIHASSPTQTNYSKTSIKPASFPSCATSLRASAYLPSSPRSPMRTSLAIQWLTVVWAHIPTRASLFAAHSVSSRSLGASTSRLSAKT